MILTRGTCAFLLDPVLTVLACEVIWEPWQGQVNCTPISDEQAKSALSILLEEPTEDSNEERGKEDRKDIYTRVSKGSLSYSTRKSSLMWVILCKYQGIDRKVMHRGVFRRHISWSPYLCSHCPSWAMECFQLPRASFLCPFSEPH